MNKKWLKRALISLAVVIAAYYAFFAVLTHLGEEALEATGLHSTELSEALSRAEKSNRYILADMSAIWCPTCRKLDQKIFSNEKVKQVISEHYIFTRLEYETEQGKAFMKRHGLKGFPTLLILDKNEKKLLQLPLTFDPELFIDYLTDFIEMKSF